jgi:cell division protein FtsI/penicillin-binding protein 2
MVVRSVAALSETQKKRSLLQRMVVVHAILLLCLLIIVARLMKLQLLERNDFAAAAHSQHYGDVKLSAQRGEILALNSKTNETSILATNTTLDLLYVDPSVVENPTLIAEMLADVLLTPQIHEDCSKGNDTCPRELLSLKDSPYAPAFDPLLLARRLQSGALLEPVTDLADMPSDVKIPDLTEVRRRFARDIEGRISEKRVTFVPLKYSATKPQKAEVEAMQAEGIEVNDEQNLIYADPEQVPQSRIPAISRRLATILEVDPVVIQQSLRSRPLRYVPIMRRLPTATSLMIKERKLQSMKETNAKRAEASKAGKKRKEIEKITDPLRGIALINEHWRYYPDGTIASHVVGFLNANQEAQYGIERTFEPQLRGQDGSIATFDPQVGQILDTDQVIVDPKDGDTIVLTIDPFVQKEVERILQAGLERYAADSGQAIVMDPRTGRIIAMANAPLFERNGYASVYAREPMLILPDKRKSIVVEIFHPVTNVRVVKAYIDDVFTPEGRKKLPQEVQDELTAIEKLYDLDDLARHYLYVGEFTRREIFPTDVPDVWLKYENNLGVGAYLNRTIQEIYEPGSVMKPITMAIAIDQGEVMPNDRYYDTGEVKVDEFTIRNAFKKSFGDVNMTECLEFSINTCMTNISDKLGKKLFHRMIDRFGFGRLTGVELEDELSGAVLPWQEWSNALLATAAFGQGVSATPLQVITAFSAIANDGRLMKPHIVDSVVRGDGTVEKAQPAFVDQVITPQTADTVTAMLVQSVDRGYANYAAIKGYRVAGKTGTSQIARPGGGYEAGTGSTVASFVGFAPAQNPRFITLVKFDRPKRGEHGSQAAAPIFKQIATFLFEYYGIPPER